MKLYLLAHQDDELFCLPAIRDDLKHGKNIKILVLTDGEGGDASSKSRNRETVSVIKDIGGCPDHIKFIGSSNGYKDGRLIDCLDECFQEIIKVVETDAIKIDMVIAPCYEGGHQDHDAISYLLAALVHKYQCQVLQFSLYNAFNICKPLFRVMSPLPSQVVSNTMLEFRITDFKYIFFYKTQWKSMVGLGPFLLIKLILRRRSFFIDFSPTYVSKKPHEGDLLYERRGTLKFKEVAEKGKEFISRMTSTK